jgi:hypothetical protein
LTCIKSFPGFSDKDLEDIVGGGGYKPDKNKGRSIDFSNHAPYSDKKKSPCELSHCYSALGK